MSSSRLTVTLCVSSPTVEMTTFPEIAKKLPPRLLAFRARLQLAIACANILL